MRSCLVAYLALFVSLLIVRPSQQFGFQGGLTHTKQGGFAMRHACTSQKGRAAKEVAAGVSMQAEGPMSRRQLGLLGLGAVGLVGGRCEFLGLLKVSSSCFVSSRSL